MDSPAAASDDSGALRSAVEKAYLHVIPLLFLCYVIAYVDRVNVGFAATRISMDLPAFNADVIGTGGGIFFLGYFVLSVPSALLVELGSARRWICRFMVAWGIIAALTALVKTSWQFYAVRFGLGLTEAGFFPGVIVYLTHWFPARDRGRALALFMIGTPVASVVSPKISNALLKIGTDETINGMALHHAELVGLKGWQCVYIFWGI